MMKLISNKLTDVYITPSNIQTILMTSDRRYSKLQFICPLAAFTSRFLFSPSQSSADHHEVNLSRDYQTAPAHS